VGYGDIYPRTYMGRLIMFICSMFGVVVVSFVVVTVKNQLEMTAFETKAFTVIRKTGLKSKIKNEAAIIISKAAKLFLKIKKNKPFHTNQIYDLKNKLIQFKNTRR